MPAIPTDDLNHARAQLARQRVKRIVREAQEILYAVDPAEQRVGVRFHSVNVGAGPRRFVTGCG